MKALIISIRPEHALDILKGDKKLELRKSVPKGFVGWVYGYVTKGGKRLAYENQPKHPYYILSNSDGVNSANGTIPFRFWFEEYISYKYYADDNTYFVKRPQDFGYGAEGVLKSLCLTREEFKEYGKGKDLYAWHIKKLEVFDKPMELGEFHYFTKEQFNHYNTCINENWDTKYLLQRTQLTKAPQSWQYVYVKGESNE